MPTVNCPSCGQTLDLPTGTEGKSVKCGSCAHVFTAAAGAVAPPTTPGTIGVSPELQGDEVYAPTFPLEHVPEVARQQWAGWRMSRFATAGAVVLDIFTCGLFGLIYYGIWFGDIPKVSRNDFGAGKAIGFMFIPYFNLYWLFRFWLGLCDRLTLQFRLRGRPDLIPPRGLAMAMCILMLCGFVPYLGILAQLAGMICRWILIAKIQGAVNQLVDQAATAPAPVTPP